MSEQPNDATKEILSALAGGAITTQEATSQLRTKNIDALETLVTIIAGADTAASARSKQTILGPEQLRNRTHTEFPTKHKAPYLPILVSGTLYDPPDINRFDGVELHFIPKKDHIVAIDDRHLVEEVWQHSYLSNALENYQYGGYQPEGGVRPAGGPDIVAGRPPRTQGGGASVDVLANYDIDTTYFYEHFGFEGEKISLPKDRGYHKLSDVGRGSFGLSDWNDVISSISTMNRITVLYEHVDWGGSTLTLENPNGTGKFYWDELRSMGWDDRTSSVGTW
ncbi:hypothetical protein [Nocardia sp. NPDC004604]|uniref:hypothetical protein n=1 Tax=Nocardia sp. NPDC004604 TaxID=3157013 RepID=UPI0033A56122